MPKQKVTNCKEKNNKMEKIIKNRKIIIIMCILKIATCSNITNYVSVKWATIKETLIKTNKHLHMLLKAKLS